MTACSVFMLVSGTQPDKNDFVPSPQHITVEQWYVCHLNFIFRFIYFICDFVSVQITFGITDTILTTFRFKATHSSKHTGISYLTLSCATFALAKSDSSFSLWSYALPFNFNENCYAVNMGKCLPLWPTGLSHNTRCD